MDKSGKKKYTHRTEVISRERMNLMSFTCFRNVQIHMTSFFFPHSRYPEITKIYKVFLNMHVNKDG